LSHESRQNVCHTSVRVNSEQAALRKVAYIEAAGQTLATMIEWEASEAYHRY